MAKDITIKVTGQNADGSLNVQQVGGDAGNPFSTPTSTAMTPYQQQQMMVAQPYKASINGVEVIFASEADYLKADRAINAMVQSNQPGIPSIGGGGILGSRIGAGAGNNWLRTGAHAAEAVAGFLNGRNVRRKLEDLDDALLDSRDGRAELDNLERTGKYNDLIPTLRRLFLAERDATEASVAVLEDQLTAVDIQTGAGVAKVASDLMADNGTTGGGTATIGTGVGGAVAAGGLGLGLGLLLSNRDNNNRDRPRRRR